MGTSPRKHREAGFRPINSLDSTLEPTFASFKIHDESFSNDESFSMVNERAPARTASMEKPVNHPLDDLTRGTNAPSFGKPSPLRNPLKSDQANTSAKRTPSGNHSSVFNKPKQGVRRPEHHRPQQPNDQPHPPLTFSTSSNSYSTSHAPNRHSSSPSYTASPSFVEIPRPSNFPIIPAPRPTQPLFATAPQNAPSVNAWKSTSKPIDLTMTTSADAEFNPDRALGIDRYGAYDPTNFVDSAQANENIKALLEGAFDDEDDQPKTRLRKRKQKEPNTIALTEQLNGLRVADKKDEPADVEEDDGTVDGLSIKLLPHQIDGVAWMLDKEVGTRKKNGVLPKGGILADDMGLGKTIQALALILSNRRPSADDLMENPKLKVPEAAGKGTLIVAPLALIKQWEAEIKDKVDVFPKLKVLVHHGPSRTKRSDDLKKYDVVITTYQTLTSEHGDTSDTLKVGCFGLHWYRIILDEAHSIKNRNAKMTKAAYDLKAVYRWCLTGTPMQNNLDELQSLIRFLKIKPYCEIGAWREQIAQPMKNGRGGLAMKRLQYFLKAFMKRRTKEVLKKEGGLNFGKNAGPSTNGANTGFKIVARNVQTVTTHFDAAEREFYQSLEARTEKNLAAMMGGARNDYIGALVLLLRLRQSCNHPDLIKGSLQREKESMSAGSQQSAIPMTPRKKASNTDDLDDVADMFGAMSVKTKKCDSCGSKLDEGEASAGMIRCGECEADMQKLQRRSRPVGISSSKKDLNVRSHPSKPPANGRKQARRVVDSDDEDEEGGEWLVSKDKQKHDLGKAGGADDEDAEGGGRWLGDENSDTEDEDSRATMNSFIDDDEAGTNHSSVTNDREHDDPPRLARFVDQKEIPSTKIRKLLKILEEESDEHKFIVFSEFTSMLDLMEPFLRNAGFRFTRYDGSMKNDDREASLEKLRNDQKTRILLCSLRCGSLGLNLTAASRVVIMEPFWNPFVEEQAIDRVHRLNQTKDVTVYRLTIADCVEERILDLQQKKRELANAAIEGGKAVGKLNMQDILRLFKRDAEHDSSHEDPKGLALTSGRPAGLLNGTPRTTVRTQQTLHPAPTAPTTVPLSPFKMPSQVLSPAKKSGPATAKFTIPKSLQGEYAAYKQRDVWSERR